MSVGAVVYKVRTKYKHGLRVAHWRDKVRPRILQTAPIGDTSDLTCEIHVMTSASDWLNLLWALKSFYRASMRHYALCIHDDGTLDEMQRSELRRHFPQARLIDRAEANARMDELLADYSHCRDFRRDNVLAPKIFDFVAYLNSPRLLLLDSDVLFFVEPTTLLQRIEDPVYGKNTFNADFASAYTIEPEQARQDLGFELLPCINSGLALVHQDSIRSDWIEEFLSVPSVVAGHFWRIEQTLFALCSSKYGVELLPEEYTLHLEPGIGSAPFRHYVGAIRHLMYGEGIAHLVQDGFLKE